MSPASHVHLRLLSDGRIAVALEIAGQPRHSFEGLESPIAALELLRERLAPVEQAPVHVLLSAQDGLIAAWTTHSSSLALYWTAAMLAKTWNATDADTPPSHGVTRATGKIRRVREPAVSGDCEPSDSAEPEKPGKREDVA